MSSSTHTRQRRIRISDAADAIARRDTFVAGDGSLTAGFAPEDTDETGGLPLGCVRAAAAPDLCRMYDEHGAALYVVRSYGTPIAWGAAAGPLTVLAVRYGVTTSRHQGIARRVSA